MLTQEQIQSIAADIAENPLAGKRSMLFDSFLDPNANTEGEQLRMDMNALGLTVTEVTPPYYLGGGGSTITVSYTYNSNATNIDPTLRSIIADKSARIAYEKSQSAKIIKDGIKKLIDKNPNSKSDEWAIVLSPSNNSKYLQEYLGTFCPEGTFGFRTTQTSTNEYNNVIWGEEIKFSRSALRRNSKTIFNFRSANPTRCGRVCTTVR